jgi:NitT/TauT family transport system substrate-binding protein
MERIRPGVLGICLLCALAAMGVACSGQDRMQLIVNVPGRTMSKLPFVIALDQGLYEKYGLDVELWLPKPDFDGGVETKLDFWTSVGMLLRVKDPPIPDILVNGHTPQMLQQVREPGAPRMIALAATDCSVRSYVIARPEIKSLEELKGKRLGINSETSTSGFAGLRVAQRMGWDRERDIKIVIGAGIAELRQGEVEAIAGDDAEFEAAQREGFTVVENTRTWEEELAGNSVLVSEEWLRQGTNREAARRFLKATAEAVAMFHQRPAVAVDVLTKWYGMPRDVAESRYSRTEYIPRKPFPCADGVRKTMGLYDSEEMKRYQPGDFYDDSLMRELDDSGFLDSLYK